MADTEPDKKDQNTTTPTGNEQTLSSQDQASADALMKAVKKGGELSSQQGSFGYVQMMRFLYEHHPRREKHLKIDAEASPLAIVTDAMCAQTRNILERDLPKSLRKERNKANSTSDLLNELGSRVKDLRGWVEARKLDMQPLHEDIDNFERLIREKTDMINAIRDERAEMFGRVSSPEELYEGIKDIHQKIRVATSDVEATFTNEQGGLLTKIQHQNITQERLAANQAAAAKIAMNSPDQDARPNISDD